MKLIIGLCVLFISLNAFAALSSRTSRGLQIMWPSNTINLEVYGNTTNSEGINGDVVSGIMNDSVNAWNGHSKISLRFGPTIGMNQAGLNEIYFSSDPTLFNGTGVVGVTQISYKEEDGIIQEADVLINDNFSFSTNRAAANFLGNVVTHEMGHFLGLGHDQVQGSTMFYALSRGQNTLSDNDKNGLYAIYPIGTEKKSIKGMVVGGRNLYGVFGAYVSAISEMDGKIKSSAVSDVNGNFSIDGLSVGEKYYLYTAPLIQVGLPSFYNSAKTNFCDSGTGYRGSFFSACGGAGIGYPQAIYLSDNLDVGKITIRCSLDSPTDYLQKKGLNTFNFISSYDLGIGNAFVGMFTNSEMSGTPTDDHFIIDLTSLTSSDWQNYGTSNVYLKLMISNQEFYSPMKAKVHVTQNGVALTDPPVYLLGSDGEININTTMYLPIDLQTSSNNYFEVSVSPESMAGNSFPIDIPYSKGEIFPSFSDFEDHDFFYFAKAILVQKNGDGSYTKISAKNYQISDNRQCPDAMQTYPLSSFTTGTNANASNIRTNNPLACGTIAVVDDDHHDHDGPPKNMFIGLLFGVILAACFNQLYSFLNSHSKLKDSDL